jgi:GGDEF domain-containing protein
MPNLDSVTLAFAAAAALVMGAGAWRLVRRRSTGGDPSSLPTLPSPLTRPELGTEAPGDGAALARRMTGTFLAWLAENEDHAHLWISFDQLVRELLTEHLGATRVRCYHVRPGCETLQTIAQAERTAVPKGPSAREGVLGHVAATGKEFVADDAAHGPLLDHLAAASEEHWAWVWPVRVRNATAGIIAVGNLRQPGVLTEQIRQTAGQLVSLCWRHVACIERLQVVQRTDRASGVLTRNDFFTLAGHALADSYTENEPVVIAVLALEGLRGLDDAGRWHERDALIERLGQLITRRLRSDDLVGRFADDRFVILLRRLDSGLGRLIADKTLTAAKEGVEPLEAAGQHIRMRIGLAGSGLVQPPLEDLLVAAFDAVERARKENAPIVSDLGTPTREAGAP